ncbi:MAG: LuxR family transcriptional regulator [Rhodobacterales bacterium]|nr:LuxR family transcriptional regulator [Rhodobacterales bacterium]
MRISEFIESANDARCLGTLTDVFRRALTDEGFDHHVYGALSGPPLEQRLALGANPVLATDYPEMWIQHYFSSGYMAVDPIVTRTPTMPTPFDWDDLRDLEDVESRVFCEAGEAGLRSGVCVPIHAPFGGCFALSAARSSRQVITQEQRDRVQAIAGQFHTSFQHLVDGDAARPSVVHLTPRERECLLWSARGKSSWDIGMILHVSEHTVNFHMRSAMRKLECGNRIMAIVKAIRMGLILP